MNLFEEFKKVIPSNRVLCAKVSKETLKDKLPAEIKENFSMLLGEMQERIYAEYLLEQNKCGQNIIDRKIKENGTLDFYEMDRFLLSIAQSRKSRAGKAFEFIIEELMTSLDYPFASQVNIDGAKPDYVLPSERHFLDRPLDSILLTAKRTLRERWRQVVTEANKGYGYFLATLDKKITNSQLNQASSHKIYVVVPYELKETIKHYNDAYNVISFEDFFDIYLDPAMRRWGYI